MTRAQDLSSVALALLLCTGCGGGKAGNAGASVPARPSSDEAPVRAAEKEPSRIQPPPQEAEVVEEQPSAEQPKKKREPTRKAEVNPRVDAKLAARIKKTFGERCRLERTCGDLLGIDCQAAVDGPYYYAKPGSLETISTCGGACMGGRCTNCPPAEWDCETY